MRTLGAGVIAAVLVGSCGDSRATILHHSFRTVVYPVISGDAGKKEKSMKRFNRLLVPVAFLVVAMLISVGTSTAGRVCFEDQFGAEYNLSVEGPTLGGVATFGGEALAVLVGSRTRVGDATVYGLNFSANCPLVGPVSVTAIIDRSGFGVGSGYGLFCDGEAIAFCDIVVEGEVGFCDEPAFLLTPCNDRDPREKSKGGWHPLFAR
jgi:hypothetical protein